MQEVTKTSWIFALFDQEQGLWHRRLVLRPTCTGYVVCTPDRRVYEEVATAAAALAVSVKAIKACWAAASCACGDGGLHVVPALLASAWCATVSGSFNEYGSEGPIYCGFCDGRLRWRPLDERPVSRATHVTACGACRALSRPWQFPACEGCASQEPCYTCGATPTHFQRMSPHQFDSDEDEDWAERNAADVRVDTPRFTPLSRTVGSVGHVWKRSRCGRWFTARQLACTGCALARPMVRFCFDVVMHWDEHRSRPRGAITERYRHRLCVRCALCVMMRPVSVDAASAGPHLRSLIIRPEVQLETVRDAIAPHQHTSGRPTLILRPQLVSGPTPMVAATVLGSAVTAESNPASGVSVPSMPPSATTAPVPATSVAVPSAHESMAGSLESHDPNCSHKQQ